jgi:hypothetical protein
VEEQQDDVRAVEVLVADPEPRPGARLLRGARLLGAVVAELAWGLLPGPSVSDVVVRRRDDGTEVLRIPAGDPLLAGDPSRHVRDVLERLAPGVPPRVAPSSGRPRSFVRATVLNGHLCASELQFPLA